MSIKIKHLKQFILILVCVFFAGFNYLNLVNAETETTETQATCDKLTDTDCDGLTNTEEVLYGTDSNKTDTDGDGYSDGVEVKSGYDPTKPSPDDKVVGLATPTDKLPDTNTASASDTASTSLTEDLTKDLATYVDSKGSEPITSADINDFVSTNLADKEGAPITLDTLPTVDTSKIKIIDQTYASLSAADKKKQISKDAEKYFLQVAYLIMSSSPKPLLSEDDFNLAMNEFSSKLSSFSESNTDYAYFLDLANRADAMMPQLLSLEVPQTFVDLHIKIIRIAMGFLSLRDMLPAADKDPVLKMILLSKIQDLSTLLTDFFQTDFANYTNQL